MNDLDLFSAIFVITYAGAAFFLYAWKVTQIYWWIRKHDPDLYRQAVKGLPPIDYLVVDAVRRKKLIIGSPELERMYASLGWREKHLVAVLAGITVMAIVIGLWKLFA